MSGAVGTRPIDELDRGCPHCGPTYTVGEQHACDAPTPAPAGGLERRPAAPLHADPWAPHRGLDPLEQWRLDGHR